MADEPILAFVLETTALSDALVRSYVAAQQIQIDRDFEPTWGFGAVCIFVPREHIPPDAWRIYLRDHAPVAGELGFHDDVGNPTGYAFVVDAISDQVSWTVTLSHEVLELLADPLATKTATIGTERFAWEVCDACEDDQFAYPVAGHHLSDFVLPSWFDPSATGPYTFRGSVKMPLALAEGGYIGVQSVATGQWVQRFPLDNPTLTSRMKKGPSSRTMRRFNVL